MCLKHMRFGDYGSGCINEPCRDTQGRLLKTHPAYAQLRMREQRECEYERWWCYRCCCDARQSPLTCRVSVHTPLQGTPLPASPLYHSAQCASFAGRAKMAQIAYHYIC